MNISNKLKSFQDELTEFVAGRFQVSHYYLIKEKFPYIRWQELQIASKKCVNNKFVYGSWEIVIDYFTREEYDPIVDEIINFINNSGYIFHDLQTASNTEMKFIMHEFTIEVA